MAISKPELIRTLRGLELTRQCLAVGDGYAWVEQFDRGSSYFPVSRLIPTLGACRGIVAGIGEARLAPLLPHTVAPDRLVYEPLTTPLLLGDAAYAASQQPATGALSMPAGLDAEWPALLTPLGALAASLHASQLDAEQRQVLPHDQRVMALVRVELSRGADARVEELPPQIGQWATEAVDDFASAREEGLLHGRLSLGVISIGRDTGEPARLMGWAEAGLGAALYDVGYIFGELVEAAVAGQPDSALVAARNFIAAYVDRRGRHMTSREQRLVRGYTALRIVGHMSMRLRVDPGARLGVAAMLAAAGTTIPWLTRGAFE